MIEHDVLLDADARVAGLEVAGPGQLRFVADRSVTLLTSGNVVVRGRLTLCPADSRVVHLLRFIDVDERRVVGGATHEPVGTDVGLWVMGDGVLHAEGSPTRGWVRESKDPSWGEADELVVAPMSAGEDGEFRPHRAGDAVAVVEATDGFHTAEVCNLTRSVRIEGTAAGRAHVMFLECRRPQVVRFVAIRHVGPRPGGGLSRPETPGQVHATGRYGLHLHMCGDGSRGTLVEGVVVRDCGSHAFVAHGSHGVTFDDCIAFGVAADAYWWDPEPNPRTYPDNATHDVTYRHCAAFDLRPEETDRGFLLSGFHLGQGGGNRCLDCVTVGCRGGVNSSGFHWPSKANGMPENVWEFVDCVAHDNDRHGIFVWQNDSNPHLVERFRAWGNGGSGINHGAYLNRYTYRDVELLGNAVGITLHAGGRGGEPTEFIRVHTTDPVRIAGHPVPFNGPARFIDCELPSPVVVDGALADRPGAPGEYEFVDCRVGDRRLEPGDVQLVNHVPGTIVRIEHDGVPVELGGEGSGAAAS